MAQEIVVCVVIVCRISKNTACNSISKRHHVVIGQRTELRYDKTFAFAVVFLHKKRTSFTPKIVPDLQQKPYLTMRAQRLRLGADLPKSGFTEARISRQDNIYQVKRQYPVTASGVAPRVYIWYTVAKHQAFFLDKASTRAWQDVAVYIRNHSEAEFSHGL
jgi:hypothetical protein